VFCGLKDCLLKIGMLKQFQTIVSF
jgi:hypothetical protein